jgi:hypothetical protein
MLSIDFGNSYTKVALRRGRDERTELIQDRSLVWDEFNICVPTLAAEYSEGGKPRWLYGTDVAKYSSETAGLKVYRNWKPHFFEKSELGITSKAVSQAKAGASRGAPSGITAELWAQMERQLEPAALDAVRRFHSGSAGPLEGVTEPEHKAIAAGFFRWLFELVDPVCRLRLKSSAAEIPARVSLPSFGSVAKAELLLNHILTDAGWRLDNRAPTLAEPLSNAIGTFTEGMNGTRLRGTQPDYGVMFRNTGGLLTRFFDAFQGNGPKSTWVLIADVGGYTTDFAMVGIELDAIGSALEGELEGKKRLSHMSKALGVAALDRRVQQVLSPTKQKAISEILEEPDQQRLESFHARCYRPNGVYALKRVVIGSTQSEKNAIGDAVQKFADEVATEAEKFLEKHQYNRVDDLILTGGGTLIPAVRDTLCRRIGDPVYAKGGLQVHTYFTEGEKLPGAKPPHRLPPRLIRGATAVGGASVYFDYA